MGVFTSLPEEGGMIFAGLETAEAMPYRLRDIQLFTTQIMPGNPDQFLVHMLSLNDDDVLSTSRNGQYNWQLSSLC